ncbi:MAG TPA: hypothetical protein DCM68_02260 [Verrucomicrobia bacterium]|nr:hypothetical protein [Verrucomicrobiota bacterium]
MKWRIQLRRFWSAYFDSHWIPLLVFAGAGTAFVCAAGSAFVWRAMALPAALLFFAMALSFLGILAAGLTNFIRRRWTQGLANLLALLGSGVAGCFVLGSLMLASMLGPSEDGFAENLSIPADLAVAEPQDEPEPRPGAAEDAFQRALLDSLAVPGGDDATLHADVSALETLGLHAPGILARHLASSPAWRVFTEHGNRYATRRWMIGPQWQFTLHGYYTRHSLDTWNNAGLPDFQTRLTLGLSGKPWAGNLGQSTRLKNGESVPLRLSEGNGMPQSHCVISAASLVVEIFEQSPAKERRLTQAALSHLQSELAPLVAQPSGETLRSLLPPGSIRRGPPSFDLHHSFQPGIYNSALWLNPGEPGMVYLKAFEVTKGTPLSRERLKEKSNEWVGWSDDPEEQFFSNTHFTIYEGDWGKPYAARFEVWFVPDSGAPERKLLEKAFKIEGWQR